MDQLENIIIIGLISAYFGWLLINTTIKIANDEFDNKTKFKIWTENNKRLFKKEAYRKLIIDVILKLGFLVFIIWFSTDGFKKRVEEEPLRGGIVSIIFIIYSITHAKTTLNRINMI